jgi:hypothetical protein
MKGSGTIPSVVIFVCIVVTSMIVFLILPNVIAVWDATCDIVSNTISTVTFQQVKNACTKSPVQIEVIIKPEYLPLTADHTLRSLLESTDSSSGKQIQELLGYAVVNKKSTFSLDGKNIDLEQIIDQKMSVLSENKDYYLNVKNGVLIYGDPNIGEVVRPAKSEAGNIKIYQTYKSSTTLTTPDMKKVQVVLIIR